MLPLNSHAKIILIADAHLHGGENQKRFDALLSRISLLSSDFSVIFLGDLFDLWFALPGYGNAETRDFLNWCAREKKRRTVALIEGNHEFYPAKTESKCFDAVSDCELTFGKVKFIHGDLVNRADWRYRLLRAGVRNGFTRTLLRLARPGGLGPRTALGIRHALKSTNLAQKKFFPSEEVRRFLEKERRAGTEHVILGHFHERRSLAESGVRMDILPAFAVRGEIGLYDIASDTLRCGIPDELIGKE